MLQKANRRSTLLWAAAAVLACLAVEYVSFGLSQMDWSVPLLYGGDGVSGVNGVKEALSAAAGCWAGRFMSPRPAPIPITACCIPSI